MSCARDIPVRLRGLRVERGLGAAELGSIACPAAVRPVERIEAGRLVPPPGMLASIARALGCGAAWLCGWEGDGSASWEPSSLPRAIAARRRELRLSASALARSVGWKTHWLLWRERGEHPTTLEEVELLAPALGCDPAWLLGWGGGTGEPSPVAPAVVEVPRAGWHAVARDAPPTCPEEWRPCPGWPRYQVSDQGRVRSRRKLAVLKQRESADGYRRVNLCHGGTHRCVLVHRLVCEAFHGPAPEGCGTVDHLDARTTNNRASNLEWVSGAENTRRRDERSAA